MTWRKEDLVAARENAVALAEKAVDLKASDPVVLDVSATSDMFSHLVILTANSQRHAVTLGEALRLEAKGRGLHKLGMEGTDEGKWILLDLTDIVVHVFLPEVREYYNLEFLWADAVRVDMANV